MEPTITAVSSTELRVTNTVTREEVVDKNRIQERIRRLGELMQNNLRRNEEIQTEINTLQAQLDLFNLPSVIDDIARLNGGRGESGGGRVDDPINLTANQ